MPLFSPALDQVLNPLCRYFLIPWEKRYLIRIFDLSIRIPLTMFSQCASSSHNILNLDCKLIEFHFSLLDDLDGDDVPPQPLSTFESMAPDAVDDLAALDEYGADHDSGTAFIG
jgi:hypothetical protein